MMPDNTNPVYTPSAEERALMESRMLTFIFPNHPRTEEEQEAFDKAVELQIAYERSLAECTGNIDLPAGTKSFSIGNFSMSFEDGTFSTLLTKRSISPAAYGILLQVGLLYKGVERGGWCCCNGLD